MSILVSDNSGTSTGSPRIKSENGSKTCSTEHNQVSQANGLSGKDLSGKCPVLSLGHTSMLGTEPEPQPCSTPCAIQGEKLDERSDLSIAGVQLLPNDSVDEPCYLTNDDTYFLVDDDDPEDDLHPERKTGAGLRWSAARPCEFWSYFNLFVRYWPKKAFHVKYAYQTGFVQKKRRGSDQPLPLFEALAIEMTERHLDPEGWAEWKHSSNQNPVWLGLQMPKYTMVDALDIDAKQYLLGYYQEGSSDNAPQRPVVHLPLEHFMKLKRIYDKFPDRIWCISSETLGMHAWKRHSSLRPTLGCHNQNKKGLTEIGLGSVESHPMPGRCFRRPFGADYRTITPDGVLTHWIDQLAYFENDGRTPDFKTLCNELLSAVQSQWESWRTLGSELSRHKVIANHQHEIRLVKEWLASGCPLELSEISVSDEIDDPIVKVCRSVFAETTATTPKVDVSPIQSLCQGVLAVTLGEQPEESLGLLFENVSNSTIEGTVFQSKSGNKRQDLSSMRHGNWAKELLRLARIGLEQEDSVATVVHEMAKWLWWIELYVLPEKDRCAMITELLTDFVLRKHNGCVSRLLTGNEQDVINQVSRCVHLAGQVSDTRGFAATRQKWLNGGYKFPIQIVPALKEDSFTVMFSLRSDKNDGPCGTDIQVTSPRRESDSHNGKYEDLSLSSSSSCPFTVMCINFDEPLPYQLQDRIKSQAGRNKILPFATHLVNRLNCNNGKEYLGRATLLKILGYGNPNQLGKYLRILEKTRIIKRGTSYSSGRNGKLITLEQTVMKEMSAARDQSGEQKS